MKRANCSFILGVLVFNVSLWAGETGGVLEKPLAPLIGHINPGLVGIGEVELTITPSGDGRIMDSEFWERLGAKVEGELSEAGLKVYDPNRPYLGPRPFDLPEFDLEIDVRRFDGEQFVFSVRASLARPVYIVVRDAVLGSVKPGVMVKAAVWTISSSISPSAPADLQVRITEMALKEAKAFIAVWVGSNPPEEKRPDTDATITVRKASEGRVGAASSKVQYVGSRNSTVFHSRDCRSVKRISSKNLTAYKTRSDAIKAGKRPCMLCNP